MKKAEYHTYLQSLKWQLKREAVGLRAHGRCERCKFGIHDETHHLTYANVGNEPLEDLIALCRGCHQFLHNRSSHDPAARRVSPEERLRGQLEEAFRLLIGAFNDLPDDNERKREIDQYLHVTFPDRFHTCTPYCDCDC